MAKPLGIVAAVFVVVFAAVCGWRSFFTLRPASPEKLVQTALASSEPAKRERAAVDLGRCGQPVSEHLIRVLQESPQAEVRAACIRGLAGQWSYRAMPRLLDLLEDPDPLVRAEAGMAVRYLLQVDLGFSANAPERERQEVVRGLRVAWEKFQHSRHCMAYARSKMKRNPSESVETVP